jgi:hypothetical protein
MTLGKEVAAGEVLLRLDSDTSQASTVLMVAHP